MWEKPKKEWILMQGSVRVVTSAPNQTLQKSAGSMWLDECGFGQPELCTRTPPGNESAKCSEVQTFGIQPESFLFRGYVTTQRASCMRSKYRRLWSWSQSTVELDTWISGQFRKQQPALWCGLHDKELLTLMRFKVCLNNNHLHLYI